MIVKNRNAPGIPLHPEHGGPSRTKQSFADDCNINLIVKRHAQRGLWDHLSPVAPRYGDFSKATDLQTAIELVTAAEEEFMQLPAAVRTLVDNDPVQLLNALADEDGFRDLVDAGLPTETKPEPIKTETTEPVVEDTPTE